MHRVLFHRHRILRMHLSPDEAMHVAYRIEPHWDGATLTFERTSRTASGLGAWSDWTMATCEGQITDQEG